MNESITLRISDNNSSLTSAYSLVINVNGGSKIALVSLNSSVKEYAISINETNNIIKIENCDGVNKHLNIKIPPRFYNIKEINEHIREILKYNYAAYSLNKRFDLEIGSTPMNCRLNCNHSIDFTIENSLASAIGIQKIKYQYFQGDNSYHQSDKIIYKAKNVNSIKVMGNMVKGSFDNSSQSHSIYEFFPREKKGAKIIESSIKYI
jgi:hypothetical protein